ncbi:MAG: hydroxymethylbilane synthase [Mycobacteriales bacterium]|nr:MAG: hydroxymethylbilane synthase [Pseudonocardiales bacterium]
MTIPPAVRSAALRLGTRGSALAQAQAQVVAAALRAATRRPVELVTISTAGDRSGRQISELGGTGVFVAGVRDALLAGEVDLAVHSYKDLPTAPAPGLVIAAVPTRADGRDAVVSRHGRLGELPAGSRVGTGAARRIALLKSMRRPVEVVPIRGNVTTRIDAVDGGRIDAVVVALAGLQRLGAESRAAEILDPREFTPAPAQGALAVECRADDEPVIAALADLDDPVARATVTAERALLRVLEAGCTAPVGAVAGVDGDRLQLLGMVAAADGTAVLRRHHDGPLSRSDEVGEQLAAVLLAAGATDLLGSSA